MSNFLETPKVELREIELNISSGFADYVVQSNSTRAVLDTPGKRARFVTHEVLHNKGLFVPSCAWIDVEYVDSLDSYFITISWYEDLEDK